MDGNQVIDNGIKETIYQVFDAVLPAETGHKLIGINEYEELATMFRQMVDMAVDDNLTALHTSVNEQLEAKDAEITALNANLIDIDTRLRESIRKEQYATENYERAQSHIERLDDEGIRLANALAAEEEKNVQMIEQLKAKDDQIAKLTEEINKPKQSTIIIPSHTKPNATLQQMMEQAKNKSIKTQAELALSGETFRGTVQLTPPKLGGGETDNNTFHVEAPTVDIGDSGVLVPEAAITYELPPSVPQSDAEVPTDSANGEVADKAVETELEKRLNNIESRLAQLEQSAVNAA
ncbi:hypothetical protein [Paenibacillus harenae]|uniref:hypothetical protein n=1 Tax=Paenibacillus harenae TaxID=306543 RepID=UPI00278D53C8|nr:hypothetical protein [Paenibacillus harenae]MDQ0062368.1 chromosome segregation ATPase [Paenibacillus harenae]